MKTVYVGMSGGVDSSVTAALLKEQGYTVVGVYMKNWSQDLPGMPCTWKEDYQDAKRVAVQLGIDFKVYDFEKQYRHKVVNYMLNEYKAGRTPNPDIMCNQEIKFKLFLETALEDGADLIAAGHYARIGRAMSHEQRAKNEKGADSLLTAHCSLLTAANKEKDQTYFLYRVTKEALSKSLMPIGEFETKNEVRLLAKKMGLATADKKDSQGICFVGKVGIKDFLLHELGPQPAGAILNQNGQEIGEHDGAIFYTIGQRHGLDVGGGLPYYVVGKDMSKNQVFVTTDLQDEKLWQDTLNLTDVHWISGEPLALSNEQRAIHSTSSGHVSNEGLQVRTRYRAPLVRATLQVVTSSAKNSETTLQVVLSDQVRAVTPGQSAVIYAGEQVLGGGIVLY